jgi:hypothetical protein
MHLLIRHGLDGIRSIVGAYTSTDLAAVAETNFRISMRERGYESNAKFDEFAVKFVAVDDITDMQRVRIDR